MTASDALNLDASHRIRPVVYGRNQVRATMYTGMRYNETGLR